MERVARSTGDDFARQPGGLVIDHVEPRRPGAPSEVPRVRPSVHGRDRHDEAHPVDRSYEAPAPSSSERELRLRLDQHFVRGLDRLGPKVVLIDVLKTISGQRWYRGACDRR